MSINAFSQVLTVWLWLNIFGSALLLFDGGPQQRFWILLTSAALSYISLRILSRFDRNRT
jgi:hypothetical protein